MTASLGLQQNGQQQQPQIQQQLPHHHSSQQHLQQQAQQQQNQAQQQQSAEAQLLRSKSSIASHSHSHAHAHAHAHAHTRPVPISSAADLRRPSSGSAISSSDIDGSGLSSHTPHLICEFLFFHTLLFIQSFIRSSFLPPFIPFSSLFMRARHQWSGDSFLLLKVEAVSA